jgi:hypothetical protein
MDAKKHPLSKKLHANRHPGESSHDKFGGPITDTNPMMQPDQGMRMDGGMDNSAAGMT